jgi:hypothetical protein
MPNIKPIMAQPADTTPAIPPELRDGPPPDSLLGLDVLEVGVEPRVWPLVTPVLEGVGPFLIPSLSVSLS